MCESPFCVRCVRLACVWGCGRSHAAKVAVDVARSHRSRKWHGSQHTSVSMCIYFVCMSACVSGCGTCLFTRRARKSSIYFCGLNFSVYFSFCFRRMRPPTFAHLNKRIGASGGFVYSQQRTYIHSHTTTHIIVAVRGARHRITRHHHHPPT